MSNIEPECELPSFVRDREQKLARTLELIEEYPFLAEELRAMLDQEMTQREHSDVDVLTRHSPPATTPPAEYIVPQRLRATPVEWIYGRRTHPHRTPPLQVSSPFQSARPSHIPADAPVEMELEPPPPASTTTGAAPLAARSKSVSQSAPARPPTNRPRRVNVVYTSSQPKIKAGATRPKKPIAAPSADVERTLPVGATSDTVPNDVNSTTPAPRRGPSRSRLHKPPPAVENAPTDLENLRATSPYVRPARRPSLRWAPKTGRCADAEDYEVSDISSDDLETIEYPPSRKRRRTPPEGQPARDVEADDQPAPKRRRPLPRGTTMHVPPPRPHQPPSLTPWLQLPIPRTEAERNLVASIVDANFSEAVTAQLEAAFNTVKKVDRQTIDRLRIQLGMESRAHWLLGSSWHEGCTVFSWFKLRAIDTHNGRFTTADLAMLIAAFEEDPTRQRDKLDTLRRKVGLPRLFTPSQAKYNWTTDCPVYASFTHWRDAKFPKTRHPRRGPGRPNRLWTPPELEILRRAYAMSPIATGKRLKLLRAELGVEKEPQRKICKIGSWFQRQRALDLQRRRKNKSVSKDAPESGNARFPGIPNL